MIELILKNSALIAVAFASIGLEEAVIKPIAKKFIKRKILKYAPMAMNFLDEQMPRLLTQKDAQDMSILLKETLEGATGESWDEKEINELFEIYDPRITAEKHKS